MSATASDFNRCLREAIMVLLSARIDLALDALNRTPPADAVGRRVTISRLVNLSRLLASAEVKEDNRHA